MADRIASLFQEFMPRYVRGRLADLGCGRVPLYGAYRGLVTDVVCVDWWNTTHGNEHVDIECDLSGDIPLPDGGFDTVILSDVLEHIPRPETLWRETARLLRPGGAVLISVPFYYWLHEAPHDYHRFTEFALRRSAAAVGLEVVLLRASGGAPEILADVVAKNLQRIRFAGRALASAVQGITAAFVRTRAGRRLSERTSREFPLGYFLVARKPEG